MGILNHSLLRTDFEHINPLFPGKSKPRNKPQHQLPVKRVHLEIRLPIYTYIYILYILYIYVCACVCYCLLQCLSTIGCSAWCHLHRTVSDRGPLSPQVGDDQDPPLAVVALGVLAQGSALRTSVGLYTQWPIECCRLSIIHDYIIYIYNILISQSFHKQKSIVNPVGNAVQRYPLFSGAWRNAFGSKPTEETASYPSASTELMESILGSWGPQSHSVETLGLMS